MFSDEYLFLYLKIYQVLDKTEIIFYTVICLLTKHLHLEVFVIAVTCVGAIFDLINYIKKLRQDQTRQFSEV